MNSTKRNFKLFIDFDGTITNVDVGEAMFLKFGDPEESNNIIDRWIKKEITSVQTWQLLCKTVENFDAEIFDEFLSTISVDYSFFEFDEFCNVNNLDRWILSDGLDYYIERILSANNLRHIPLYSNKLGFDEHNNLVPEFPYTDEECRQCANCKRNHIINNSSDTDFTVYIGDGYSDTCPAQYCDFVFAKNSLLKYCEVNRITYFPFNNFSDVQKKLKELMNKKRLKKRHQAELKRKQVYLQG
ncbi:MAG: MtnX-like HAD-IB family phosphatase [Ignavibacteriae bacterium]|nr:2-hydroxy-3-keto-5-methylthiopentenyl-1-phosphate phosphatase [Ignavibacteriota bacterium]NOG96958.1 MtnX-like HAD-IB family phosphatase [Ignavibacteriota bacterium]